MLKNSYIIKCPWCRTEFSNVTLSNCTNCGGTIEYQKNTHELGPKPLIAPRELPAKFVRRIKYTGNVYTMIGVIFTVPFFWSVIFPIIGIFMWRKGLRDANDELIPLQHGSIAQGEITSVEYDHSKTINGKHPLIVNFSFAVGGRTYQGNVGNIFTSINQLKQAGEPVWIVYMPENPDLSSVWPPMV